MGNETINKFVTYLSFKDAATGKFVKATKEQIAAIKKAGVEIKKQGKGMALDFDKMGKSMTKAGRHARTFGFEVGKLAGQIGRIRNLILVWVFALRPLIQFTKEATQKAQRFEDAIARLNISLKKVGKFSKSSSKEFQKFAAEMQKTSRFGEEDVMEAMDMLLAMGGKGAANNLKAATQATIDFAVAMKMDLKSAVAITAKAFGGYIGAMSRYGTSIAKNIPESAKFAALLKAINKQHGGKAAKDIYTYAGAVAQLSNVFDDWQKRLGLFLIMAPSVRVAIIEIKNKFIEMGDALKEGGDEAANFNQSLAGVMKFGIGVGVILKHYVIDPLYKGMQVISVFAEIAAALPEQIQRNANRQSPFTKQYAGDIYKQTLSSPDSPLAKKLQADMKAAGYSAGGAMGKAAGEEFQDKFFKNVVSQGMERLNKLFPDEGIGLGEQITQDLIAPFEKLDKIFAKFENKMNKAKNTQTGAEGGPAGGLIKGLETFTDKFKKIVNYDWELSVKKFADSARQNVSTLFFDVVMGDLDKLTDAFTAFGNTVIKIFTDMAAHAVLGSIFGGAFAGKAYHGGGTVTANRYLGGGPVRRFQGGGIVPAMLEDGEGVLNRTGMRNLGSNNLHRLNRGDSMGGGPQVVNVFNINAIDNRSFRDYLAQNPDVIEGIYSRSMNNRGGVYNATMKRMFG